MLISPPALVGEIFLSVKLLSCINDYTEDKVTFTALVKIYSTEYFCNTKVTGPDEIFVQRKFSAIWYYYSLSISWCSKSEPEVQYAKYHIAGNFRMVQIFMYFV